MKNRYFVQKTLLTLCLAVLTGVLMLGANAAFGTAPTYEPPGEVHVAPTFSALTVEGNVRIGVADGIIALGHGVRTANRAELHLHSDGDNVSEIMFGINNREDSNVKWGISSRPSGAGGWEGNALHILEGPYNTGGGWNRNMSFLPGGNVGIGVAAPTARLDVRGSALVSEDLVVGESLGVLENSVVGGNLGVGTTSPAQKLHVNGGRIRQSGSGGAVELWHGTSYGLVGTTSNTKFAIRTNNADRMTILANGNVGIGTTNPTQKLEVDGNVKADGVDVAFAQIGIDSNVYANTYRVAIGRDASASGHDAIALGHDASASGIGATSLGRFSSASGNASVSIGDSAKATRPGATALGLASEANADSSTALGFGSKASHIGSTAVGNIAQTTKNHQIVLGSWEEVYVPGKLGIGTTTPAHHLVVADDDGNEILAVRSDIGVDNRNSIRLPGLEDYTTGLPANLRITGAWNVVRSTSSERYKRDIQLLLPDDYEKVLDLNPVTYRSKNPEDGENLFYGFIAEEVAKVDQRLVEIREIDGEEVVENVFYDRVSVLLQPIVRELYYESREQRSKIESMSAEIDVLKAKLDALLSEQ